MTKILTTTIAYLLITAAVYLVALPPTKAQSSELSPQPLAAPATIVEAADSPRPDCFTYLENLTDCLNYVQNGSTLRRPDPACCPELSSLIHIQPICLCELLSNSTQFYLSIDTNRALNLPSLCNINTPPVTMCADFGIPVAVTPSPSAANPPPTPPSPSTPSPPGNDDNAASRTILLPSNQHFLIGVALVLFTSILSS